MVNPEEFSRLEARVHRLADDVQSHRAQLGEHKLLLKILKESVDGLRVSMATSEQLDALENTLHLKLDNLTAAVDPIKRGVYWIVTLVLGAVVLAGMALLLRRP